MQLVLEQELLLAQHVAVVELLQVVEVFGQERVLGHFFLHEAFSID